MVDHVFPPVPACQRVLSVPKQLHCNPKREPKAISPILHIFLRMIEAYLQQTSPKASAQARLGAASFVHRFGASLNRPVLCIA